MVPVRRLSTTHCRYGLLTIVFPGRCGDTTRCLHQSQFNYGVELLPFMRGFSSSFPHQGVAWLIQIIRYSELLCETTARRSGENLSFVVVVLHESVKAYSRLILLRITQYRPLGTPVLPVRKSIPEDERPSEYDASRRETESLVIENSPGTGMMAYG